MQDFLVTWIFNGSEKQETVSAHSTVDAMLEIIARERDNVNAIRAHPVPEAER